MHGLYMELYEAEDSEPEDESEDEEYLEGEFRWDPFTLQLIPVSTSTFQSSTSPPMAAAPQHKMAAAPQHKMAAAPQLKMAAAPQLKMAAAPQLKMAAAPQLKMAAAPQLKMAAAPQLKMAAVPPLKMAAVPPLKMAAVPPLKMAAAPQLKMAAAPQLKMAAAPQLKMAAAPQLKMAAAPQLKMAAAPQARPVTAGGNGLLLYMRFPINQCQCDLMLWHRACLRMLMDPHYCPTSPPPCPRFYLSSLAPSRSLLRQSRRDVCPAVSGGPEVGRREKVELRGPRGEDAGTG
ncbi:hypothetical protein DPEC_G00243550 [Dallia pectoralis]|uniref:Uncharacterized protein n=1 Tax=Dallia pectoralis TaxID=75939 RepID=A0ACC2FVS3_DALPE|nr:hypothetical protein DPEC_G00243550 [Dallia pectoralis]